jgi:hypothetical protein
MIVGEAHVIVRAMTQNVRRDIERAFSGLDAIGADAGRDIARGFNRGGGGRGAGGIFASLVEQSDAARAQFDSLIRTTYLLGPAIFGIVGALSSLVGAFSGLALAVAGAIPSLVALPGIFAAIGVAALTLKLAFQGVGSAISSGLQQAGGGGGGGRAAERDLTGLLRRLEDARERYRRTVEESNRLIENAEERVTNAKLDYDKQILDSQRDVEDARRKAAITIRDGIEDIADAQARLQEVENRAATDIAKAKRKVERAQLELNEAYKQGREEIQQLNFAAEDAVIAEKRAALELEKAREKLLRVQDLPPNSRARKEAELAFAQADLNYRRAMDRNSDLSEEQERISKEGIEGTAAVSRARNNLASAEESRAETEARGIRDVEEARIRLARTERDVAEARQKAEEDVARAVEKAAQREEDAKKRVAEAEENLINVVIRRLEAEYDAELALKRAEEDLAKARKQGAASGVGGVNAYQRALKKLSKEQRDFVKFMVDEFVPATEKLRNAAAKEFFPKLIPAMRDIKDTLFPALVPLLRETGSVLGNIALGISSTLTSPQFLSSLENIWDNINQTILPGIGSIATNLIKSITRVLEAAQPVVTKFVDWMERKTGGWADNLVGGKALEGLTDFFNTSASIAAQIGELFGNVFGGIGNLIGNQMNKESGGRVLLQFFIDATARFKEFTEQNPERITNFFKTVTENAKPILSFLGDLVKEFLKLGENPQIKSFFEDLNAANIGATIREIGDAFLAAGPQISDFITNFLEFTKATIETEGVQAFFGTFSAIFKGLADLFKTPAVQAIAPTIASIAAVGVVLRTTFTLLKIPVLGLLNPFIKLGKSLGEKKGLAYEAKVAGEKISLLGRFLLLPAGTLLLITAAVAGAVAAFVAMWRESEIFREAIKRLISGVLDKLVSIFETLRKKVDDALEPLGGMEGVVNELKAAFKGLGDFLGRFIIPILEGALLTSLDVIGAVLGTVIDLIGNFIRTFTNIFKKISSGDIAGAFGELLYGIFIGPFDAIFSNMLDLIQNALGNIKKVVLDNLGGTLAGDIISGVLNGIIGLIDVFKNAWQGVIDWIKNFLGISSPSKVFENIGNSIIQGIKIALTGLLNVFLFPFTTAWNSVKFLIDNVFIPFWRALPQGVRNALTGLFGPIFNFLSTAWANAKNLIDNTFLPFIRGLPEAVATILKKLWEPVSSLFDAAVALVQGDWEGFITNLRTFVTRFKTALSSIWSPLLNGLQEAWRNAKAWWNNNVAGRGFSFGVGPYKVDLKIPALAEGGVIPATRGGMLALIGEGGRDERVEPLDSMGLSRRDRDIINLLAGDNREAKPVTINVYAGPGMDEIELANIVSREISFMMRKGSV